jgi:membrane dipeptidase
MLVFDAHLDLSLNAIDYNRDLRLTVPEIREMETGLSDFRGRQNGTVAFPEMRSGHIGLSVATLLAPCCQPENPIFGWRSPEQGWAQLQGQLAWYRQMELAGELTQIRTRRDLETQLEAWSLAPDEKRPLAYLLSLEGADPLVDISYLEVLVKEGLRAMGPTHYGIGRYGFGTDTNGPLPPQGRELLKEMVRLKVILDVTHLCDECFWDAVELYDGPIWASHSNCRALVDHNRQFDDRQLEELIARGAVIGAPLDAWMMIPGWVRGKTTPQSSGVKLEHMVDHIDHICQLAGNSWHVGIGSDLDGGFGTEQSPSDLDTIADLQRVPDLLRKRGYNEDDIHGIMHGNFVRLLRDALPD